MKRNHASVQAALPPLDPGAQVLEIGGGVGQLSFLLAATYPEAQITCIDLSPEMTRRAQASKHPENLRFEQGSFWSFPGRYALVVCAGCWEFFPRDPSAARLVELLQPGGTAIINSLAPVAFSRTREVVFARLWETRMWLHTPEALAASLRRRGCEARWEHVNAAEGSYTLAVRRLHGAPAGRG